MDGFFRINKTAESLLVIISERPITLTQMAFNLRCNAWELSEYIQTLLNAGYIRNSRADRQNDNGVYLNDPFAITVDGKTYLEQLNRHLAEEKRGFRFQLATLIVSIIALILSVISLLRE